MDSVNIRDYENDVLEAINEFTTNFKARTSGTDKRLTIKDIESMLSNLVSKTNKVYLDMTSDMISEIDEKELITSKK